MRGDVVVRRSRALARVAHSRADPSPRRGAGPVIAIRPTHPHGTRGVAAAIDLTNAGDAEVRTRSPEWTFALFVAAVVAPTALELAGAWSRTTAFDGGVLTVRSPILTIGPRVEVLLVTYLLAALFIAGRFVRALALASRDAQRRLQLQAWHLRQLVP